jgi:hypothetical protein
LGFEVTRRRKVDQKVDELEMTKWGFGWCITELLNLKKLAKHVWTGRTDST